MLVIKPDKHSKFCDFLLQRSKCCTGCYLQLCTNISHHTNAGPKLGFFTEARETLPQGLRPRLEVYRTETTDDLAEGQLALSTSNDLQTSKSRQVPPPALAAAIDATASGNVDVIEYTRGIN